MAKAFSNNKQDVKKEITAVYLSYTPCNFTHNGKEYYLYNNETYQLPDTEFVRSLIGQGRLDEKK